MNQPATNEETMPPESGGERKDQDNLLQGGVSVFLREALDEFIRSKSSASSSGVKDSLTASGICKSTDSTNAVGAGSEFPRSEKRSESSQRSPSEKSKSLVSRLGEIAQLIASTEDFSRPQDKAAKAGDRADKQERKAMTPDELADRFLEICTKIERTEGHPGRQAELAKELLAVTKQFWQDQYAAGGYKGVHKALRQAEEILKKTDPALESKYSVHWDTWSLGINGETISLTKNDKDGNPVRQIGSKMYFPWDRTKTLVTNDRDDVYVKDQKDKIFLFSYRIKERGLPGDQLNFRNIRHDKDGNVNFFRVGKYEYERLPADPKSPIKAVREGNAWTDWGTEKTVELGKVTFDQGGFHKTGPGELPFQALINNRKSK